MLRVSLMGELAAHLGEQEVRRPASRRAWELLGFLALHPGPQPRADVAAALWPDVLDSSARASMRSALWALRPVLGGDGALVATRDRIGLADGTWTDLGAFAELAAAGALEDAVALCRGDLLAGMDDGWVLDAREAHRDVLRGVLAQLAERALAEDDLSAASGWARRAAALDPFDEEALRRLMRTLAATGDAAAALAAYERAAERLRRELRVAPSAPTRALADELRGAAPTTPPPVAPDSAPAPAPAPPPTTRPGRLPLIGRAAELAQLRAAWAHALAGHGGVALVRGDPGIGKTRLVGELAAEAGEDAHPLVAHAGGLEVGTAPPFGLWAELLGAIVRAEPPPPDAPWASDLAMLVPALAAPSQRPAVPPDLERARLFEATATAIEATAQRRPLLLVLEDLHVADPSSLELAGYAARRLAGRRILLLATARHAPRPDPLAAFEHTLRARDVLHADLALAPLPRAEVEQLARAAGAPDAGDAERVADAAAGNALIAVEAARALAAGEEDVPAGLRAAVRAAIAPLDPGGRSLVEAAAVAGRPLAPAEAQALGVPDPAGAARAAAACGLLTSDPARVAFRHALLREAVYAELPAAERTVLHERAAAGLGHEDAATDAAERARHLRLAGHPRAARDELVRAARLARAVGAFPEAERFVADAGKLAPDDPELAMERGENAAWHGDHEGAAAALADTLAALGPDADPRALAELHLRFADWHVIPMCRPHVAGDACRTALQLLEGAGAAHTDLHRRVCGALAWCESVAGDPGRAEALLDDLEAHAVRRGDDDYSRADRDRARVTALTRRGRFRETYPVARRGGEAAVRARRLDLAYHLYGNAAGSAACAGDLDVALELLDRLAVALEGAGMLAVEGSALLARSWVLQRDGRLGEAQVAARAARRLAERIGSPALVAEADHELARAALAGGDAAGAEELFAAALAVPGAKLSRPLARLWRAEALTRLGRTDDAEAELRAVVLEPVRPGDWPDTLVARMARAQGLIAAARGDHALARRRLDEAAAGWRRRLGDTNGGERWAAALADIGRPVLGVVEPAVELARVEEDLAELSGRPTEPEEAPIA